MTTKKRGPAPSPAVARVDADARQRAYGPNWRWLSFPVFAAFVLGALIASFVDRPDTDFAVGIRILLVIAAAYCFAHILAMYLVAPRIRARRGLDNAARPPRKEAYEDELVYKDE
jgi:hypothetical protein